MLVSDWTRCSSARPPLPACGLSLLWERIVPVTQTGTNQSVAFVLSTYVRRQSVLLPNMSATSVFPMCVRASRGFLRLRDVAMGTSSPAVVDIVRAVSTEKPPAGTGSATGGLAQAILQERLQQQPQSQVRLLACMCALDLCMRRAVSDMCGAGDYIAEYGSKNPPTRVARVNKTEVISLTLTAYVLG